MREELISLCLFIASFVPLTQISARRGWEIGEQLWFLCFCFADRAQQSQRPWESIDPIDCVANYLEAKSTVMDVSTPTSFLQQSKSVLTGHTDSDYGTCSGDTDIPWIDLLPLNLLGTGQVLERSPVAPLGESWPSSTGSVLLVLCRTLLFIIPLEICI